jgi:alkylation response protein AidB-like acyl-CoA dehydrogenase
MLSGMAEEMLWGVNAAFGIYVGGGVGVALVLQDHATQEVAERFAPQINGGRWAGTMALTEPQAGTDLGLVQTKAEPVGDGTYRLSGTKIFLSGGDQDLTENIVHLVLARLPDAPVGTRGISLFLVPKYWVDEDGRQSEEQNGVQIVSIEEKMGLKASVTCQASFEAARGHLIGGAGRGLRCMFTMMNYERVNVGLQGLGSGEIAYQNAAAYAKERLQGRAPTGIQRPHDPADTLLAHADVRRMLMTQRAFNEGGRAFAAYVSQQLDRVRYGDDATARRASQLVDLLTPVLKAFASDKGFEGTVLAQQVWGGHGYIKDNGMEQLVRDARIAQIYEGANGVISMDLVGRKVFASGGHLAKLFFDEIDAWIAETREAAAGRAIAKDFLDPLEDATARLRETTTWLVREAQLPFNDANELGAAAVEYLHLFGYTAYAWMWSRMALAAAPKVEDDATGFYRAKLATGRFFMRRLLPLGRGLEAAIRGGAEVVMALDDDLF